MMVKSLYCTRNYQLTIITIVGAYALANTFEYCGKARILGVVSDVNSRYAIPAMDAINTWYCHPSIPFARNRTLTNETAAPNIANIDPTQNPVFVTTLADPARFPQSLQDNSIKVPLDFYRETLSEAKDHSVTIIAIGYLQNLDALYHSPGGQELIQRKVRELVVGVGDFGPNSGPNRAAYNLAINITAAKVLEDWPSPVTFLGSNIGGAVITGQGVEKTPVNSPVRVAYEIYYNGTNVENGSWDLLVTYFAVLGLEEGSFQYGNDNRGGRIEVFPNATAKWNYNVTVPFQRRQHFLE
ncbi:hypothetical protein BU17DRAFT_66380 [Hysterangium stoloniferum]|nr:hypothetical protein BU17DRAFT_66380 [Hysterangium stoloniferum]